jgi:2-methylisocitrate lyase-like PEP mutase family enzyme
MAHKLRAARDAIGDPDLVLIARTVTPLVPVARLEALGYQIVIIPSDLQRAAIRAMDDVLAAIARDGSSAALAERMVSFTEREGVVDTAGWLARDVKYGG